MSCCKNETKNKAVETACCDPKAEDVKPTEKATKSDCGCQGKEASAKKDEKEKAGCC